jgi:hypothetical protein
VHPRLGNGQSHYSYERSVAQTRYNQESVERRITRATQNSHKRNEPVHMQAKQTASHVRGCAHRRQLRFVHGTHADASTSRSSGRRARTHQRTSDCCRLGDTAGAVDAFLRSIEVRDVLSRRLRRASWSMQPALHMLSRICTWTGLTLPTPALGRGSSPATSAPEPVCSRVNGAYLGIDAARSFGSEVSAPKFRSDVSRSSQVSDLAWQLNGPYRGIDSDLACTHEALASCYLRQGVLRLACRILADGA